MPKLTLPVGLLLDPPMIVKLFKANGFVLTSETCPLQLRNPWTLTVEADGSSTYEQTLPQLSTRKDLN